jgi:hypothetical protein
MPLDQVVTRLFFVFGLFVSGEAAAQSIEYHTDRPGNDFRRAHAGDASSCQQECRSDDRCRAWTFVKQTNSCMLKDAAPQRRFSTCCASGLPDAASIEPVYTPAMRQEPSGNEAWRDVR